MYRTRDLSELGLPHLHEIGEDVLTRPADEDAALTAGDDAFTSDDEAFAAGPLTDAPYLDIAADAKRGFDEDEEEEEGEELDFDEFEDDDEGADDADDDADADDFDDDDDDDDLDDLDEEGGDDDD